MEKLTMANETKKTPTLQQRIAARQAKRIEIGKEAQIRVAAAYTIAKTMLPTAPVDVRKKFASVLLAASTKVLKAALRQTALNAHYTKIADTLREVHKVEMNQLLEASGDLEKAKSSVKSELSGDAKSAAAKTADDRKDAGPQPAKYDEGNRKEPEGMDASKSEDRKADTVDKTEGGEKIVDSVQDSARAKNAAKVADLGTGAPAPAATPAPAPAPKPMSSAPKAPSAVIDNKAEIRASDEKESSTEKEANFGVDGKPNAGEVLQTKTQTASVTKKAEDMPPMGDGATEPGNAADALPAPEAPAEEVPPAAAEGLVQDDMKGKLLEKVEEAANAVQAIETEITQEESPAEEIDLTGLGTGEGLGGPEPEGEEVNMQDIFSDTNLTEKASNLANEHHESADEDFFGPSASADLEANLDQPQMASLEDMFAHEASADPMASLFERTAATVDGFEVVNSFQDAAKKFQSEHGTDDRDNKSDHDEDILSLLVEGLNEQDNDQERVKQDATPALETPAAKEASKKPGLKHIKTSAAAPAVPEANVADILFASIDAVEDERNIRGRR
jgi:hypothetical protein